MKRNLQILSLWFCGVVTPGLAPAATSTLTTDAGLWISTWAIEELWHQPDGHKRFPGGSFDRKVRSVLHGAQVDEFYNKRENAWRKFSDAGVGGMVVGSFSLALGTDGLKSPELSAVSRAFAANNFLTVLMKNAVHRSRPKASFKDSVRQDGDNAKSFPSGHASNALAAASCIVLMTPARGPWFHAVIYGIGASIGFARIMADRHFFTDVLVGGALGFGVTHLAFNGSESNIRLTAGPTSLGLAYNF
jgi:hypothetical protein